VLACVLVGVIVVPRTMMNVSESKMADRNIAVPSVVDSYFFVLFDGLKFGTIQVCHSFFFLNKMASKKVFRKRAHSDSDEDDSRVVQAPAALSIANKKSAAVTTFSSKGRFLGSGESSIVAELDGVASEAGTSAVSRHGVFAISEIDTGTDQDGRALYERQMALQDTARESVVADKKLYRGVAGYSNFIHKDAAEAASRSKVTGSHGPLRAPSNVRGILRMDYAPDICKGSVTMLASDALYRPY
jgi:hypothetical protein